VYFLIQSNLIAQQITIDKDGVKHIHNTASVWGNNPKVELQFVRKVGDINTADSNYIFYQPRNICKDEKGNFYFLDKSGNCIKKFDNNWKFIRNIGRRGQGPGEFNGPEYFNIDNKGNLYVMCPLSLRIIMLKPDGIESKRIKIPIPFQAIGFLSEFRILDDEKYIIGSNQASGMKKSLFGSKVKNRLNIYNFRVFTFNGDSIREFGDPDYFEGDKSYIIQTISHFDIDKSNNIYIAYAGRNEIEKRNSDGGKIYFIADRLLDHTLSKKFNGTKPISNLVSKEIGIDSNGRIWVVTYTKEIENIEKSGGFDIITYKVKFDIFSNDGIWLGGLPVPIKYNYMRVIDNSIYFFVDQISIVEYKIVSK
jgi:hypothetical protein